MLNSEPQDNRSVELEVFDGVLVVWLDSPGRSVNLLDRPMLEGLEWAIQTIEASPQMYSAVVFRSRKPACFFAGADVEAIAAIQSESDAVRILECGQSLMQRIDRLPMPTIALIAGTCLGGGLELALACRHRVALDESQTKLGLPEIKLGLIPGWGGTQRLPKLIGLQSSFQLILSGRSLSADKALRFGLVDAVLSQDEWPDDPRSLLSLASKITRRAQSTRPPRTWIRWALDSNFLGRQVAGYLARRSVTGKARQYPALIEAIKAIESSSRAEQGGYVVERDAFARLLFTRTARGLLSLFLARDRARKTTTWIDSQTNEPTAPTDLDAIKRVAIIGAGAMGAGIGTLAAMKGFEVIFKELDDMAAEAGERRVKSLLQKQVDSRRMSPSDYHAILRRVSFTTNWLDTANCDLAIEAVLEIESVKREVFEMLDRSLTSNATLATNTSSLCVTRLASSTNRHPNVVGIHFFNPVDRMDLVEVIRTESASLATLARAVQFVRTLGKTPLVTSDKPGFLVNRILFPYLSEAVHMVSEGFDVHQVDRQLRRFGMPMGPMELMDQIGIDIVYHVAQTQSELSSVASAHDHRTALKLLSKMMQNGWLGKKSGIGFYMHDSGEPVVNEMLPKQACPILPHAALKPDGMTDIQRRLIYPILNEAVRCLDELVVAKAWMVDLGMVLGTGFAPHTGGPLHLIDSLGVQTVAHNLNQLEQLYGTRFAPADGFARTLRRKENFLGSEAVTLNWENHDAHRYTEQH